MLKKKQNITFFSGENLRGSTMYKSFGSTIRKNKKDVWCKVDYAMIKHYKNIVSSLSDYFPNRTNNFIFIPG